MSRADEHTIHSDLDIERNELMRLMGTAKSDDRKAIIRESLVNLDCPPTEKFLTHNKRTGSAALIASRFSNIFETEKVAAETVFLKSPPVRPISARLRRPSMNNLDVIQEERRLSMSSEKVAESPLVELRREHITGFSSSCHDPRLFNWDPFSKISSSRWISTGMAPQFLSIDFSLSWIIVEVQYSNIRRVRLKCLGVKVASISFQGNSGVKHPLKRENNTTFSYAKGVESNNAIGDRVTITLEESSEMFIIVESIHIRAMSTAGS